MYIGMRRATRSASSPAGCETSKTHTRFAADKCSIATVDRLHLIGLHFGRSDDGVLSMLTCAGHVICIGRSRRTDCRTIYGALYDLALRHCAVGQHGVLNKHQLRVW